MGKRYGQHFLRDGRVLNAIVSAADLARGEPVLEVGPGQGALTARLLGAGARVTAVEVDPALAAELRRRFAEAEGFCLIEGDIRKLDLSPEHLFGQAATYAVVANLPYYLSTPLLFRLIAERHRLSRMVLMVQREVAERLLARPAEGKTYGSLSVAAHTAFTMRLVRRVPPGSFRPPPRVDSAVVQLTPRPAALGPVAELRFLAHVKALFGQRRKRMLGTLGRRGPALEAEPRAELERLVGERRPEALTPEEHLAVFRLIDARTPRV